MDAKTIFAFVLGAAAGVVSSMIYFKSKYEKKADEEIQEIRELYAKKTEPAEEPSIPETPAQNKDTDALHTTARHISQYTKYNSAEPIPEVEAPPEEIIEEPSKEGIQVEKIDYVNTMHNPNAKKPYRIDASEYGDIDEYECLNWDFYTDGILANENFEPIDNPQEWIGDNLRVFADTEDNIFWVRNEKYGCDIEVARSGRRFDSISGVIDCDLNDIRRIK